MSTRRTVVTFLALFATGCRPLMGPAELESFTLKQGQSHEVPEFTLTFIEVENDSRCPAQVTCAWAGNASVAVSTVDPRLLVAAAKQFLNTHVEPRSLTIAGATLRLDSLTPARITTDSIPQASYTAYFTIARP